MKKEFSIIETAEIQRFRAQLGKGVKVSPLISRELGRYQALMSAALPDWLTLDDLQRIAQKCQQLRTLTADMWWLCLGDILLETGLASRAMTKTQQLALLSFIDRLGDNYALDDVARLLALWIGDMQNGTD